jgi:hypothetical protein
MPGLGGNASAGVVLTTACSGGPAASAVQSSAAGRSELVRQQLIMLLAEMMSNQILESPRFQLRSCKDWTIFRSVGLPWDFPQRRTI